MKWWWDERARMDFATSGSVELAAMPGLRPGDRWTWVVDSGKVQRQGVAPDRAQARKAAEAAAAPLLVTDPGGRVCERCGRPQSASTKPRADHFCSSCAAGLYEPHGPEVVVPVNTLRTGARMLVLVSGGSIDRYHHDPRVGKLVVPHAGTARESLYGWRWAADNGAFSGLDIPAFTKMLKKLAGAPGCLFATVPDKVADAAETTRLFHEWVPHMRGLGYPLAYVAQNGLRPDMIPWAHIAAVFIGGDTAFKLDSTALIREAKSRGKWVHVGRVNMPQRITWAYYAGADSFDGSGHSIATNVTLPRTLKTLDGLERSLAPAGAACGVAPNHARACIGPEPQLGLACGFNPTRNVWACVGQPQKDEGRRK